MIKTGKKIQFLITLYLFPGFLLICENIMRFLLIVFLVKLPPLEYRFDDGITPMILNGQGCYIDINGNVVIGKVVELAHSYNF